MFWCASVPSGGCPSLRRRRVEPAQTGDSAPPTPDEADATSNSLLVTMRRTLTSREDANQALFRRRSDSSEDAPQAGPTPPSSRTTTPRRTPRRPITSSISSTPRRTRACAGSARWLAATAARCAASTSASARRSAFLGGRAHVAASSRPASVGARSSRGAPVRVVSDVRKAWKSSKSMTLTIADEDVTHTFGSYISDGERIISVTFPDQARRRKLSDTTWEVQLLPCHWHELPLNE